MLVSVYFRAELNMSSLNEQQTEHTTVLIYASSTVPSPPNCQRPHVLHLNVLCGPQLERKPYVLYHDMMAEAGKKVQVANHRLLVEIDEGSQLSSGIARSAFYTQERVSGVSSTSCTNV